MNFNFRRQYQPPSRIKKITSPSVELDCKCEYPTESRNLTMTEITLAQGFLEMLRCPISNEKL
ncbi:hypothetical protein OAA19_02470, partial [Rubripirellula sp.]